MRPLVSDSKGRINLGKPYASQVFSITEEDGRIILERAVLIPEKEVWLHENKKAKAKVDKGLDEAKKGKVTRNAIDLNSYQ